MIKAYIDQIVKNVENKYIGNSCLAITGPITFGEVLETQNHRSGLIYKFYKLGEESSIDTLYTKIPVIQTKFPNYYSIIYLLKRKAHYGELWRDLKLYKPNYKTKILTKGDVILPIVHIMYIPWDTHQKFKENSYDFDFSYKIQLDNHFLNDGMESVNVWLWTRDRLKWFVDTHYKGLWEYLEKYCARPTQWIDILRVLVVYHYGGLYIQYGSEFTSDDINDYLPNDPKNIKLFTEFVWNKDDHREIKQPIRNGVPEELIRVCNQIFSIHRPYHPFLKYVLDQQLENIKTHSVQCDYDILYTTANALFSTCYDELSKHGFTELVDLKKSKQLVMIKSMGSWKTDN